MRLDFEIQEAVTFRDGAAQAFGDLEHLLALESEADTRRLGELLDTLAADWVRLRATTPSRIRTT